jgi:hypothetical protein
MKRYLVGGRKLGLVVRARALFAPVGDDAKVPGRGNSLTDECARVLKNAANLKLTEIEGWEISSGP